MNQSYVRVRSGRIMAVVTGSLATLLIGAVPVLAQELPDWKPTEICARDSAVGQCLLFENRARNDIAASWTVLPDRVRKSCLTRFKPPLEPSWRILGDCIEIEGRSARREEPAAGPKQDDGARRLAEAAAERKRLEAEEATFMATLAAQREADAAEAKRQAAAKKAAEAEKAAKAAAEAKRREAEAAGAQSNALAEAERRRLEAEEASFMATLTAQRKAEDEAKKKADDERKRAAAEADRKRLEAEEASFMATLAEQRKADEEAKKKAEEAAKKKAEEAKKQAELAQKPAPEKPQSKAAKTCEAELRKIKSEGVILFAFNSAELSDKAGTATLDRLAGAVAECEGQLAISVEGHTDSVGPADSNLKLSAARAETVAKYLRDKGIAAERISSKGFGDKKPIAANATAQGRAKNRRIEFRVR